MSIRHLHNCRIQALSAWPKKMPRYSSAQFGSRSRAIGAREPDPRAEYRREEKADSWRDWSEADSWWSDRAPKRARDDDHKWSEESAPKRKSPHAGFEVSWFNSMRDMVVTTLEGAGVLFAGIDTDQRICYRSKGDKQMADDCERLEAQIAEDRLKNVKVEEVFSDIEDAEDAAPPADAFVSWDVHRGGLHAKLAIAIAKLHAEYGHIVWLAESSAGVRSYVNVIIGQHWDNIQAFFYNDHRGEVPEVVTASCKKLWNATRNWKQSR